MKPPLILVGSGGHAKVVISTCRAAGRDILFAVDSDESRIGLEVLGVRIAAMDEAVAHGEAEWILAFGSNQGRADYDKSSSRRWGTVVHPSAIVDASAQIGEGSVVFAGSIVQPDAWVGRHVILNTSCSVDHDCAIADYAHVGPGARICGGVSVGEGALMGVGSSARPGVQIGSWATVGAGSTAIGDLDGGFVYAGVPAKRLSK
ncbi:acetyltransferase [Kamptonema cortianum]|nr:acetyltransferase [Geitlerinema splendidum]MDK3155260.1 acetyltransferase [Kamptonema cortianum]